VGVVEDGMPDRQRRNQNHRKLLVVAKDRDGALSRHQRRAAWLFLFIPGVLFVLFTVVPFMVAAVVSLTDYSIVQSPRWIGLSNYAEIVRDPFFLDCHQEYGILYAVVRAAWPDRGFGRCSSA